MHLGRIKDFDTLSSSFVLGQTPLQAKGEWREWDGGDMERNYRKRSRIVYQFIREFKRINWIQRGEEVCHGSFAIKKISNITGKAEAAVPNYRDGTDVIYFTRELHRRTPQGRSLTAGITKM
jgi:hypothetical protein